MKKEEINKKISNDEKQIEAIKKQMEVFLDARDLIRKDLFKPAIVISDAYNKMIDILPTELIKDKVVNTTKSLTKIVAKVVAVSATKIAKKLNTWLENIENQKYDTAYKDYISQEKQSNQDLNFMKEVVKVHGTDTQNINDAVEAVVNVKNESPVFAAKLMNDTLKTDEYKSAFEANQTKVSENTR